MYIEVGTQYEQEMNERRLRHAYKHAETAAFQLVV